MTEFIIDEAEVEDDKLEFSGDENDDSEQGNIKNFIDDETEFSDQEASNYRALGLEQPLKNVTIRYQETMQIGKENAVEEDCYDCSDPENFSFGDGSIDEEFCEFMGWEKRIESFVNSLKPLEKESKGSIVFF